MSEKLLAKARALGMNTETRKNIFSILMTAEVKRTEKILISKYCKQPHE
jgi:hypothetical protein